MTDNSSACCPYADTPEAFNDDHRRVIEVVARQIAHAFKRETEVDHDDRLDRITGLPRFEPSGRTIPPADDSILTLTSDRTLIFVDVVGLARTNARYGRQVGDEVLRHVARHSRAALRLADVLCRYGDDEFVAILDNTSVTTATTIAHRIHQLVRETRLSLDAGNVVLGVDIEFACVAAPADGRSFPELLAAAKSRLSAQKQGSAHVH